MAGRKTCFRLMACGLLFAFGITVFTGKGAQKPQHQVLVDRAWMDRASSPKYSLGHVHWIKSQTASEARRANFNTSEVERIREWVAAYFNPDTDLTVQRSQIYPGQRIKYERERPGRSPRIISQELYHLVPESPPLLGKHFRSCAVVGNSGILLGSRCGRQIDSADFVFRCNLPFIEGFENDVGTKSNFTTMNPSVLSHDYEIEGDTTNAALRETFLKRLRLIQDQVLHIPAFVSPKGYRNVEATNKMILQYHFPIKVSYAPWDTIQKMSALWNASGFHLNRPSTGSTLFAVAACLCDQIHLYGFYPFSEDRNGRKIKYHYYGHLKKRYLDSSHEMPEEYRAFQTLHQRKALCREEIKRDQAEL
ncbi:ST8SIA4 [Branchiostoma lanceolatum]|uniref:ST8SIA4 protein n=1 Tax=Branchiostoma lanceolatum TaxID=7740 RepID=A0A8J9ZW67_BRALA|nr:ST8SIA4 [Branchiostoma lanceolatum]